MDVPEVGQLEHLTSSTRTAESILNVVDLGVEGGGAKDGGHLVDGSLQITVVTGDGLVASDGNRDGGVGGNNVGLNGGGVGLVGDGLGGGDNGRGSIGEGSIGVGSVGVSSDN